MFENALEQGLYVECCIMGWVLRFNEITHVQCLSWRRPCQSSRHGSCHHDYPVTPTALLRNGSMTDGPLRVHSQQEASRNTALRLPSPIPCLTWEFPLEHLHREKVSLPYIPPELGRSPLL